MAKKDDITILDTDVASQDTIPTEAKKQVIEKKKPLIVQGYSRVDRSFRDKNENK